MSSSLHLTLFLVALHSGGDDDLRVLLREALLEPKAAQREEIANRAGELAQAMGFERALAELRAGPALDGDGRGPRAGESLETFGEVVTGFTFEFDGDRYRYAVDIPRGYEPTRPAGLLVDPGHGQGRDKDAEGKAGYLAYYRTELNEAGRRDWLVARTEIIEQIGQDGARAKRPDAYTAAVFDAFHRDIATRFAIDPDRIVVAGLSQTGFWSWYLGRARADRYAAIAPMSASSWPADAYLANYLGLQVHVLHGTEDGTCAVAAPRATCARLAGLGVPVSYREIDGAGHEYAVWQYLSDGLKALERETRTRYPRRVSKSLSTLYSPWCHWIRVEALDEVGAGEAGDSPTGGVDAELDGQTVRVYTEGVSALDVNLASEMLDLDEPVRVIWNGKVVHESTVQRDFAHLFGVAARKVDWSATYEAVIALKR